MNTFKSFLNNNVFSKILPKSIKNEAVSKGNHEIFLMQGFNFQYLLKYLVRNLDSISKKNWITEDIFDISEFIDILVPRTRGFWPTQFYEIAVDDRFYSLVISKPEYVSRIPRYKMELLYDDILIMEYYYSGDNGYFFCEILGDIFLNFSLDLDSQAENWVFSSSNNPLILVSRHDSSYVLILHEFYHIYYIWKHI